MTTLFNWGILIAIVGLISLIYGISARKKTSRKFSWIGIVVIVVGIIPLLVSIPALAFFSNPVIPGQSFAISDQGNASNNQNNGDSNSCVYQPTGTYSAKDKFASTQISGTSYYKSNGNPAVTTAASNLNKGVAYTYWVSNSSYYVQPKTLTAACSVNTFVADSWANGTVTFTGYDVVNNAPTTSGAYNTSLAANARASERFTYQGTAHKSAMPFGGVMAIEYNSTLSSVTCTGATLLPSNPYHVTYQPTYTASTYQLFGVSGDLDDGSGSARTIDCQFQNGATAPGAGSSYIVTFIPANYYLSNSGDLVLDTEKNANQDNTRTGLGQVKSTFNWGS